MCLQRYVTNYTEKDGVPLSWAYFRMAQIYRHKEDKRNAYNFINKELTKELEKNKGKLDHSRIASLMAEAYK